MKQITNSMKQTSFIKFNRLLDVIEEQNDLSSDEKKEIKKSRKKLQNLKRG